MRPLKGLLSTALWLLLLGLSTPSFAGFACECAWKAPMPNAGLTPLEQGLPTWHAPWFQLGSDFREDLYISEMDSTKDWRIYRTFGADNSLRFISIYHQSTWYEQWLKAANQRSLREWLSEQVLEEKTGGSKAIEIDIPFKVRSKTFRRIFGSGRIGLNVTGSINISGTYTSEKRESESASAMNNSGGDFRLDQQQQFTVVGKIGEKVDVHIDQDTERSFDFENNLSIVYTGEPEEIIESIEAGNIALSLPKTKFVNFSDRSSGLFGLKMATRFGPLKVTAIASSEKNESKQQSFEGGSSVRQLQKGPGSHERNYFFINEFFQHQYRIYDTDMDHIVDPRAEIIAFDLYVFERLTADMHAEVHLVNPAGEPEFEGLYRVRKISWDPTDPTQPFELDPYLGILRIPNPQTGRYLAMAYAVVDRTVLDNHYSSYGKFSNTLAMGKLNATTGDDVVVLYPSHFNPDAKPYWDLQLRNVYLAGSPDLDPTEFDLKIVENVSGGSGRISQGSDNFLKIFHLDVRDDSRYSAGHDNRVDAHWLDAESGLLWFPSPYPFGNRPESLVLQYAPNDNTLADSLDNPLFSNLTLAPNVITSPTSSSFVPFQGAAELDTLYDLSGRQDILWLEKNSLYSIESEAKMGTEIINLGWNVTNVTVTANGQRLKAGQDYTLDELSGIIRITDPQYTRADQKIVVSYETPQLFQLRKKTFAGLTADLKLWEEGRKISKIGAAAIYFNEETAERKIRLGNEPIKNVVLDLNTELHFEPRFLTNWMDALPFIEAEAESSVDITAEVALVLPDPNPSNNSATGDSKGVAYVDDFESSKQEIPISLGHSQWFLSSKPEDEILGLRGRLGWYNPKQKVPSREIWPEYEESNRQGASNEIRTFRMEFEPFILESMVDDDGTSGQSVMRTSSWGGAYYDFRGAYDDLSDKKFLELTIKVTGDKSGFLHLDLGQVSEDTIPDGFLNEEDENSDNILQSYEDTGLDKMPYSDPPWPLPDNLYGYQGSLDSMEADLGQAYDWWDVNLSGTKDAWEPWSFDNWVRFESVPSEIDNSHGWEGNSQDSDQLSPDTEDRNGNFLLDQENNYFSYRIPLSPSHPDYSRYNFTSDNTSWVFVRIPLKDSQRNVVGTPRMTLVNGVRLWLDGFNSKTTVHFAELNIVGNEWRETIVADSDTAFHDVSVLNNFDNSDFYISPPGVEGQKDLNTGIQAREQALVIDLQDLPFGREAWVRKQFATPVSLTEYRRLKMYVHGGSYGMHGSDDADSLAFDQAYGDDKLEFTFRLQSAEGNYYEYSKFIRAGWNPANDINILFDEITSIEAFDGARRDMEEPGKATLLSDGGQVRVEGSPSINQIRTLLFGVKNHSSVPARTQVWLNELRVSDVKKEIGRAMRTILSADLSDVLSFSGNFEQVDAEFHNVKQRTQRSGNEEFKRLWSMSASSDLGRLLPPSLGMQISLATTLKRDQRLPKFYPNDDQEVDPNDHPDWVEKDMRSRGATLRLKKTKSKHWLTKNTLDKLSFDTSLSESIRRDHRIEGDTTVTHTMNLSYSNSLAWRHKLKPFSLMEAWPLVGKASLIQIGYMPKSLTLGANTNRKLKHTWNRDGSTVHTETYALKRNWSTSLEPLNALTLTLSRNYQNNLLYARTQSLTPQAPSSSDTTRYLQWTNFSDRLAQWQQQNLSVTDGDYSINQTLDFGFKPKLLTWLTTSFTYTTRYSWQRDLADPAKGVQLGSDGNFRADLSLKPDKLLQGLIFMSDESLNTAKRELKAASGERKEARAERKRLKQEERDRRKAEKEQDDLDPELGTTSESLPSVDETEALDLMSMDLERQMAIADSIIAAQTSFTSTAGDTLATAGDSLALTGLPLALDTLATAGDSLALTELPLALDTLATAGDTLATAHLPLAPDSTLAAATVLEAPRPSFEFHIPEAVKLFAKRSWQRMGVFSTSLNDVRIDIKRNGSRADPGLALYPWTPLADRHAALGYQVGFSRETGFDSLRISNTQFSPRESFGWSTSLSSKMTLIPGTPIRLRYDRSFDQAFTSNRENSRKSSRTGWYSFDDETLFGSEAKKGKSVGMNPSVAAFPDYGFSINGLAKLNWVKSYLKSLTLSHDYSGKLDVTFARGSEGMYRSSVALSKNFSPLLGLDFQLDKGWGGQMNLNLRRGLRVQDPDGDSRSVNFEIRRELSLTASKTLKKGFKIPGFRKRFDNDTTLRLNWKNSKTTQMNSIRETGDDDVSRLVWNTPLDNKSWSMSASADFRFSRNVTGGASWEYGVRQGGAANDRTSYNEFSMNCSIQIRNK
jgi:hypothetical protein